MTTIISVGGVDLIDPAGNKVPYSQFEVMEDAFYRILRLKSPQPGTYQLFVSNTQLSTPELNIVSFVENPLPDFYIDAMPRVMTTPQPVLISGSATFAATLHDPGISYRGIVIRPDNSRVPFVLDSDPLTGFVSNTFTAFNGNGTYTVIVEARIPKGANLLPGESIFPTPSEFSIQVDEFTRVASTSFTVFKPGDCPPCSGNEKDCDHDGIPNEIEDAYPDQDPDKDGIPNRCDEDSDGDDIPDMFEKDYDLNQNNIPDVYENTADRGCQENPKFQITGVKVVDPDCGKANGKIGIEVKGAKGTLTYRWSHDPKLNSAVAGDLPSFIYSVTVTDKTGCERTATINLTEICINLPAPGEVPVTVNCGVQHPQDCTFPVQVRVDLTGVAAPDHLLGSFTGALTWDPVLVEYAGPAAILSGFSGFTNLDAANGKLLFNGANSAGVAGVVDIFQANFRAIGPVGAIGKVKVEFMSFASAKTFVNLLPKLALSACSFEITESGLLGDVNNDGLVNSTDANIILSSDVGLALPVAIQKRIDQGFGDVNEDGATNATDALIVLTFDVRLPVPFPVGTAFCVEDKADNALQLQNRNLQRVEVVFFPQEVNGRPEQIEVPVFADFRPTKLSLGSYKAVVSWDPTALKLVQRFGGNAAGFESPTINDSDVNEGKLTLAHALAGGQTGMINLFNLRFEALKADGINTLHIDFGNMAAATTFEPIQAEVNVQQSITLSEAVVHVFPNPFSESVQVAYELPEDAFVEIAVYDAVGKRISTLLQDQQRKGTHRLQWDGPSGKFEQSGLFLITVKIGDSITTKRVLRLK